MDFWPKLQIRVNPKRTRAKSSGAGLGLYISSLLAKGMNGDVALEKSSLGKGSTFILHFLKGTAHLNQEHIKEEQNFSIENPSKIITDIQSIIENNETTLFNEEQFEEKENVTEDIYNNILKDKDIDILDFDSEKFTILMIDDNIDMRKYMVDLLKPE